MSLPNYGDFAREFAEKVPLLYQAEGYSEETNINNMIVQLLLMEGYITTEDVARGSVIQKVNRETIAAAKYAVVQYLNTLQKGCSSGNIGVVPSSLNEGKPEQKKQSGIKRKK